MSDLYRNKEIVENNENIEFLPQEELENDEIVRSEKVNFDGEEFVFSVTNNLNAEVIRQNLLSVEEELCGTEGYVNRAGKLDYEVAVASGFLTGVLDSIFDKTISLENCQEWSDDQVSKFVIKVAEKVKTVNGEKIGDNFGLEQAVRRLEFNKQNGKGFFIASDPMEGYFGGGTQHHLKDFAHHPNIAGLIFSILTQLTERAYGLGENNTFIIVKIEDKTFIGKNLEEKLFYGIIFWLFHMLSDICGSSGSVRNNSIGTGLPGPVTSTLEILSAIPIFKSENKDGKKKFGSFVMSLFNGNNSENVRFDLRTEIGKGVRDSISLLLNDIIIRAFYFFSRLKNELENNANDISLVPIRNVLPVRNRTIQRLETISKGVFMSVNVASAAIKSKGIASGFFLHINYTGLNSFVLTVFQDGKMGFKKRQLEKQYDSPKNLKLIRLYEKNAVGFCNTLNSIQNKENTFGPYFLHFDEKSYEQKKVKILFVCNKNYIKKNYYEEVGKEKGILPMFIEAKNFPIEKTRFGKFAGKIEKQLGNNNTIIWHTLSRYSKYTKELSASEKSDLNLLTKEIKILNPDAVIFLLNSSGNKVLINRFNNQIELLNVCSEQKAQIQTDIVKLRKLKTNEFAKVVGDGFPENTFRINTFGKKSKKIAWLRYFLEGGNTLTSKGNSNSKYEYKKINPVKHKSGKRKIFIALGVALLAFVGICISIGANDESSSSSFNEPFESTITETPSIVSEEIVELGYGNKISSNTSNFTTEALKDTDISFEYNSNLNRLSVYVKEPGEKNNIEELRYKVLYYLCLLSNSASKAAYDGKINYEKKLVTNEILDIFVNYDDLFNFCQNINKEDLDKNVAYTLNYPLYLNLGGDMFFLKDNKLFLRPYQYFINLDGTFKTDLDTYKKKFDVLEYRWFPYTTYESTFKSDYGKKVVKEESVFWTKNRISYSNNKNEFVNYNYGWYSIDLNEFSRMIVANAIHDTIEYGFASTNKTKLEEKIKERDEREAEIISILQPMFNSGVFEKIELLK